MEVAVVGGGVVGTLTAHFLREQGCQVTVYERAEEPASETSRANGGQLSYSFCDAMADPQLLPRLPGILLGMDPAFRIRPSLQPGFIQWGLKFLGQCRKQRRDENTRMLLSLALRSSELMQPLNQKFGPHATHARNGKLVLLNHAVDAETKRRVAMKRDTGLDVRVLDRDEMLAIEPALASLTEPTTAAIYSPSDEVANAHTFTKCLARALNAAGVAFRYGEEITALQPGDSHCGVETAAGIEAYDAVVIATGDGATRLLEPHGVRFPVLGMSGYSWTFPATEASPTTSITALSRRLVFSRLGDVIRVAGFADVNAKRSQIQARANTLREFATGLLPDGAVYDAPIGTAWHGMRAMTPDSRPIVGATALPGVYTNLGHGMLGWTLGAATSELVAGEVANAAR